MAAVLAVVAPALESAYGDAEHFTRPPSQRVVLLVPLLAKLVSQYDLGQEKRLTESETVF
jgi:hypothetical protein